MSIQVRARVAHSESDDAQELTKQAQQLGAEKATAAEAQLKKGVQALASKVSSTLKAVESVLKGKPNSKELKLVGQALNAVKDVAGMVMSGDIKQLGSKLLGSLPALAEKYLPGVKVDQLKKAFAVGQRMMSVLRNPSAQAAAGVLKELGIGRTGSVTTFLLDGIAGVIDGKPFDVKRFLPGALGAVSKDLLSRAQALADGEDNG